MKFAEFEVVRLLNAHLEVNLNVGEVGTVIFVHTEPNEAYEVEFANSKGETIVQITLLPDELERFTMTIIT